MQIVDPNNLPKKEKKARALKGGEPFSAEPDLSEASEQWKVSQLARLKLRNEVNQAGAYGNAWPTLDAWQDYGVSNDYNSYEMQWDEEAKRYYTRTYYRFGVKFRYYRGNRSKSYLFWPSIVVPGYMLQRQNFASGACTIDMETGSATYVRIGLVERSDRYNRDQEVWALWKSDGTMKERRTKNGDTTEDSSPSL